LNTLALMKIDSSWHPMNYKSVIITRKGPPSVLQVVDTELRAPASGEVRVKILYTGVGFTDLLMRYGDYRFAPPIPFAPGYEIVGVVDAVGADVTSVALGQRVAALTVHGGYAEYIYLPPHELIPVPDGLDAIEALSLILNYVTAYQMLHRVARVQSGQTVLFTGASGGVGNALLQLGQLAGLKMYGTASRRKHELVARLGGIPIDYHTEDIAQFIRARENGLEAAFDALGGRSAWQAYQLLRRDGSLVSYGVTASIQNGKADNLSALASFVLPLVLNALPDGRHATFYGITLLYRKDPTSFREDLSTLFHLLAKQKIKPVIAGIFPLTEAARANELLEKGEAQGKLVLRCSTE
jgi:NADPH:quinone reductase-like Zn-dependent oxidoreductase